MSKVNNRTVYLLKDKEGDVYYETIAPTQELCERRVNPDSWGFVTLQDMFDMGFSIISATISYIH